MKDRDTRRAPRRVSRVRPRLAVVEAAVAIVGLAVLLLADPFGLNGPRGFVERDDRATTVALTGRVDIPEGPVHGDVWMLRGDVRVWGTVDGDVTVMSGTVRVAGTVTGDVTVFRGRSELVDGGRVGGGNRAPAGLLELPRPLALLTWAGVWFLALVVVAAFSDRPQRRRAPPGTALAIGGALGSALLLTGLVGPTSAPLLVAGAVAITRAIATQVGNTPSASLRAWFLGCGTGLVLVTFVPAVAVGLHLAGAAHALGAMVLLPAARGPRSGVDGSPSSSDGLVGCGVLER